jgi:hypothetical protein
MDPPVDNVHDFDASKVAFRPVLLGKNGKFKMIYEPVDSKTDKKLTFTFNKNSTVDLNRLLEVCDEIDKKAAGSVKLNETKQEQNHKLN